jgi:hypothetical protein
MFSDVCQERAELYVKAAEMFALSGCFDDAQFLLNLIHDERNVVSLIPFVRVFDDKEIRELLHG